jgi:hypothetical protein
MARYTRVFCTIWADPDFTALDAAAQRVYLLLVTQPDVSHCGVLPLTERRWARLAADTNPESVAAALARLESARFVVVDNSTQEVLVRSWLKWDGQHASPNGMKAIDKARSQVLSEGLGGLIDDMLTTLTEGAYEGASGGACQGATEGDASPQQPTTNNQHPPTTTRGGGGAGFDRKLSAALELAVDAELRAARKPPADVGAWRASVRKRIDREHGAAISQAIHAGATPAEAVAALAPPAPPNPLQGAWK